MKEELTERNKEMDNLFTVSKEIKVETILYQGSPTGLDEILEVKEKSLKRDVLYKPSFGLENSLSRTYDNNLSIESNDIEKQLEVMS